MSLWLLLTLFFLVGVTVSTPVLAYMAAPLASGTAAGQSAGFTIAITVPGWEAVIEFQGLQPNTSAISAGPEIDAHRSADAGLTYETVPSIVRSIARTQAGSDRITIALPTGWWMLRGISGGAGGTYGTSSFWINTIQHVTAVQNA